MTGVQTCALPISAGPIIDKHAQNGNPHAFQFTRPKIDRLDYSFSGLKTAFLYFLRDQVKASERFIEDHFDDLCASLQYTIIDILMDKLVQAGKQTGVDEIAIAGGVSANSGLKKAIQDAALQYGWKTHIPKFEYTMDNAAMIAMTGHYKYLKGDFSPMDCVPQARFKY